MGQLIRRATLYHKVDVYEGIERSPKALLMRLTRHSLVSGGVICSPALFVSLKRSSHVIIRPTLPNLTSKFRQTICTGDGSDSSSLFHVDVKGRMWGFTRTKHFNSNTEHLYINRLKLCIVKLGTGLQEKGFWSAISSILALETVRPRSPSAPLQFCS